MLQTPHTQMKPVFILLVLESVVYYGNLLSRMSATAGLDALCRQFALCYNVNLLLYIFRHYYIIHTLL